MKATTLARWAVAGAVSMGTLAVAQGPMVGPGGPGMGQGFGQHRPPFERALGPQGRMGRWWNNPELVDKLKLTSDQRKAMDEVLQQHSEKLVDLHGNVQKAELEMEPLMRDDQPNESRILEQIDKVASARAELEKANARFLLAIRSKLSPDQWKTLQAERASHGPKDWNKNGKGWGGDGQPGPRGQHRGQMPPPPAPQGGESMMEPGMEPGFDPMMDFGPMDRPTAD